MIIPIVVPDDMAGDLLEWFHDKGHDQLRKYQRVNKLLSDDQHVHAVTNFVEQTITITVDNPPPAPVQLIASGYEWACPSCGADNKEMESRQEVKCDSCEKVFTVTDTLHAEG